MNKKSLLIILPFLFLTGCGSSNNGNPTQNTTSFAIVGKTELDVGDVSKYSVNVDVEVSWSSSDESVFEVNSRGEVTTFKEGEATLTASEKNGKRKATLNITVKKQFNLPKDELGVEGLFSTAISKEKEGNKYSIDINDTANNEVSHRELKVYDNISSLETINESYDHATNGHVEDEATRYKGINDNKYYDIYYGLQTSYAIKKAIIDGTPDTYETTYDKAVESAQSYGYLYSFYSTVSSMWGGRTQELKIEGKANDNGYSINLSNIYLFVWADGVSNDSKSFEATLDFDDEGRLLKGEYQCTVYEEHQYDVTISKFIDNAAVASVEKVKFVGEYGEAYAYSSEVFNPSQYFVKNVTYAIFNNGKSVSVGTTLKNDMISLIQFDDDTALDYNNAVIIGAINPDDQVIVSLDSNGSYVAQSEGTCKLRCAMKYSPEVTFTVDVEVKE